MPYSYSPARNPCLPVYSPLSGKPYSAGSTPPALSDVCAPRFLGLAVSCVPFLRFRDTAASFLELLTSVARPCMKTVLECDTGEILCRQLQVKVTAASEAWWEGGICKQAKMEGEPTLFHGPSIELLSFCYIPHIPKHAWRSACLSPAQLLLWDTTEPICPARPPGHGMIDTTRRQAYEMS